MNTEQDGGPAFPTPDKRYPDKGMSLRDWFAGMALQGIISSHYGHKHDGVIIKHPVDYAKCAYNYADEMLKERGK